MNKILLALALVGASLSVAHAQIKTIAQSTVFEEPEKGYCKIIQFKNGYTLYLHLADRGSVEVKIYDPAHKLVSTKQFETSLGRIKRLDLEGVFEVNGNAVVLVNEMESRTPTLTRLVIDGKTGKLISDEVIATLDRLKGGAGYAMVFGGVPMPDFFVRKDTESDYYALAMFNSFEADRNKRIEMVVYGPDNKEVSRAFYRSPDDKYKYLQFIDFAFMGAGKVGILVSGRNTRSTGGDSGEFLVGTLTNGNKDIEITSLEGERSKLRVNGGIARYNPVTKKFILLTTENIDKRTVECRISYYDPATRKIDYSVVPSLEQAYNTNTELFGRRNKLTVMPQDVKINADGSYSVLFEEITHSYYTTSTGQTRIVTELGSAVVASYSILGAETGSYLIPKNQNFGSSYVANFYQSRKRESAQLMDHGNQFKSFVYLPGKTNSYVLMNDDERNTDGWKKGKLVTVTGVSNCDAYYYKLEGRDIVPTRSYVFGEPEKKSHNLALFTISDYDAAKNIFVTLQLEKERGDKGVKLVWLQPQ